MYFSGAECNDCWNLINHTSLEFGHATEHKTTVRVTARMPAKHDSERMGLVVTRPSFSSALSIGTCTDTTAPPGTLMNSCNNKQH